MTGKWTPEMDEIVTEAYRNRTRLAVIADQLGVTRNAITSRAFKLGLSKPIHLAAWEVSQQPWRINQFKNSGRKKSS